jgi:hypothetical protein
MIESSLIILAIFLTGYYETPENANRQKLLYLVFIAFGFSVYAISKWELKK